MENKDKIITYEYITIYVKKEQEPVYIDTYNCLGWELVDSEIAGDIHNLLSTKLSFKRNRKINNKQALIKIQRDIDIKFKNIEKMESQKEIKASFNAYGIGIIACVFLALSVFMITGYIDLGAITFSLQVILGGIGVLLCIPPYFIYKNTLALKNEELEPLINREYEDISEKCEEADLLINNKKKL